MIYPIYYYLGWNKQKWGFQQAEETFTYVLLVILASSFWPYMGGPTALRLRVTFELFHQEGRTKFSSLF